jgi:hypothetical protein
MKHVKQVLENDENSQPSAVDTSKMNGKKNNGFHG